MRVTCIIILKILYKTHNRVQIAHIIIPIKYNVVHIIHFIGTSFLGSLNVKSMKPNNRKWGLNIWDLKLEVCFSKNRICFIHSYELHFISFMRQFKHQRYLGCSLRLSSSLLSLKKTDLMSLLEYNLICDYPMLTPLLSFITLCALFEAGIVNSLGTLSLIDIVHVSIMKSSFMKPYSKKRRNHCPNGPKTG